MTTDDDRRMIEDILDFWFSVETRPRWYDSTKAFDELCRQRFSRLVDEAGKDGLASWEDSPNGALALCLLLDQMPRNIFRGTPEAFATDPAATAVASRAIEKGFDQALDQERRKFLYLPYMHSERLADQERSVALSKALGDDDTLHYANDHADIIRRFGRFPHRNAILGRETTAEEKAFLESGAETYGQSSPDEG